MSASRNLQVDVYKQARDLKYHERKMTELIRGRVGDDFKGSLIDVGCASGGYLEHLLAEFPQADLVGLDADPALAELARERLGDDVSIVVADAAAWKPEQRFDVVMASGILGVFVDPLDALDRWLEWLSPGGTLFVFTSFNTTDVDTRVYYRNLYNDRGWETGMTSYARRTVREHLASRGWEMEFEKFELPIEIAPAEDPIRAWTLRLASGEKLIVNGANQIQEMVYLTAWRTQSPIDSGISEEDTN